MIRILGIIGAIISLTLLAWHGFDLPFGHIASSMLAALEREAQPFFDLFEPWIEGRLADIQALTNSPLRLYSHWKHVFILIWLYFSSISFSEWTAWRKGLDEDGLNPVSIMAGIPISFVIAFITGVAAGAVPLDGLHNSVWILAIPVIAIFLNDVIGKALLVAITERLSGVRFAAFQSEIVFSFVRFGVGLVLVAIGTIVTASAAKNTGVALLAAYILLLALISIIQGLPYDSRVPIEVGKKILYVFGATLITALIGVSAP